MPETAAAVASSCQPAGLMALTCETFGNTLWFPPPLVAGEDPLAQDPGILEDAFPAR